MSIPITEGNDLQDLKPGNTYHLEDDILVDEAIKQLQLDNVTIDGRGYDMQLFGDHPIFDRVSASSTVKNLSVQVKSDRLNDNTVFCSKNYGILKNIDVRLGDLWLDKKRIGIITHQNFGVIDSCKSSTRTLDARGDGSLGGVSLRNRGIIKNCIFDGLVPERFRGAGISKKATNSIIKHCTADIGPTDTSKWITGISRQNKNTKIINCNAIIKSQSAGRIFGIAKRLKGNSVMKNCSIMDTDVSEVGFFWGFCDYAEDSATINNCKVENVDISGHSVGPTIPRETSVTENITVKDSHFECEYLEDPNNHLNQ